MISSCRCKIHVTNRCDPTLLMFTLCLGSRKLATAPKWGNRYKTHLNLTTQGKYITWPHIYPPNINKCQVLKKWAVLRLESKYNYRYINHQTIYWVLGTNYPKGPTYLPTRVDTKCLTYLCSNRLHSHYTYTHLRKALAELFQCM